MGQRLGYFVKMKREEKASYRCTGNVDMEKD